VAVSVEIAVEEEDLEVAVVATVEAVEVAVVVIVEDVEVEEVIVEEEEAAEAVLVPALKCLSKTTRDSPESTSSVEPTTPS